MINNYLKNICLISFALIGPIYLPAGGIQRTLEDYININDSKEIVINSSCFIYCNPQLESKKLRSIKSGSSALILRHWINSDNERWVRIYLSQNIFADNLLSPKRGWIKL